MTPRRGPLSRIRLAGAALVVALVGAACVPPPGGGNSAYRADHAAALIFLWHRAGTAHEAGSVVPSTPFGDGFYDSRDPAIAAYHMDLLEGAGSNLALSWWGTGGSGFKAHIDRAADVYASAADAADMPWAIFWEDVVVAQLDQELARLADFAARPDYLRLDGKPALFVYKRAWEKLSHDQLLALAEDYTVLLDKLPRLELLPPGAGWSYWDVAFTSQQGLAEKYTRAEEAGIRWMAFVMPGLDQTQQVPPGATQWPAGGPSVEWFHEFAEFTYGYQPDIVAVPLNELGERSAVEPTVEHGWEFTKAWGDINRRFLGAG